MSRHSARKFFTPLNVSEDIGSLIRRKKLYALVSTGPIKRYSRVTHHEQVDMDCVEFTLADGSILESFVTHDENLEGVFVKNTKISASHASHAAGGGTRKRWRRKN